jgi:hypothetical protein
MTVTADTDESGNVARISISSQLTTMSDELANRAGMLREVCQSDAMLGFVYRGKFHLHIFLRQSEDVTRMDMALPSLSGGKFHSVHQGQVWRHSFHHRVPSPPFGI